MLLHQDLLHPWLLSVFELFSSGEYACSAWKLLFVDRNDLS
jgi:hypothetical protein